ncbi:MAG: YciI family protein [Sphingomicrobium sp.]
MQYLIAGILKPGVEDALLALHNDFNEHLAQPYRTIALAGALRGKDGKRTGYVAIIEADSFEDAEAWLNQSPFYANHLYERVEVAQFAPEVGYVE